MARACIRIVATGLMSVAVLSGCADMHGIAPQTQPLDPAALDAGAALRSANAAAAWPTTAWWQAYRDPQLDRWVTTAIAGSPSLALADARVRHAVALAGIEHAATLPQVNGSVSVTREHWPDNAVYYGPGELAGANTWNNTATLAFSYHLDLFGRDRNADARALDSAQAAAADARAAQLELESNLVRAYIQLSLRYALRDIARQQLDQQQQIASLAERRLRGGVGTQLEVAEAQAPLPEAQRALEALDEQIELGGNQLAALSGQGPGAAATLQRPVLVLDDTIELPSRLPAELIGQRPDVAAARWRVTAQARGIDVAKAAFYPNVDLLASVGRAAAGGSGLTFLSAANRTASIGPAVSLPIFEGGRLRSALGAAAADYDIAVAQYDQTVVDALGAIADQLVTLRSLARQQEAADQSARLAKRSYDIASAAFRRGLTDYLNVLSAQTQWLAQQQRAATIHAASLAAHATLAAALGGGLAPPADGAATASGATPAATPTVTPAAAAVAASVTGSAASAPSVASVTSASF